MTEDDWIVGSLAAQDLYKPLGNDPWTNTMPDSNRLERAKEARINNWQRTTVPDLGMNFGTTSPGEEAVIAPLRDPVPSSMTDFGLMFAGPFGRAAAPIIGGAVTDASPAEAGRGRLRRPQARGALVEDDLPLPKRMQVGGNNPPEEFAFKSYDYPAAAEPMVAPGAKSFEETRDQIAKTLVEAPAVEAPARTWAQDLPRARPAAKATEVPNIRGLPVDEAIDIARTQPHLIVAGDRSEGYYVGGPREILSKRDLNKQRKTFDDYVAADPRGGDWYDRYRAAMASVTGNIPSFNEWMAAQEGQWSAGVDPGSELHFALKENNASIAGMPVKAARPAQHEAHNAALAAKDPSLMQLGDKTGAYAEKVNSDQPGPPGATGVNDFRYARSWGHTEKDGTPQKGSLTSAGHGFLDMETALAVDRANKAKLGGRDDWTGEQLQAAPWVRQKALDIMSRNSALTYEEAFKRANMTIGDFFDRHTAFATYEQQPGSVTGHLPGSVGASDAAKQKYFEHGGSTWATAPGGRDAIYSGLGVEGTGNYMRVRPTQDMQGFYRPPGGALETNPGEVARPLVTFNTPKVVDKEFIGPQPFEPFKTITAHDRAILDAGEAVRAYVDAQNAGAWHKNWAGGPLNQSNSLYFPRGGKSSPVEMIDLQDTARKYGMGDVADTGRGLTAASFWPPLTDAQSKALSAGVKSGDFDKFGRSQRVRTDGNLIDYTDKWAGDGAGFGSGAATRQMLEHVSKTPELRDAFNRNGYIAERAMAKLERDEQWAAKWGAPRQDIQNARRIMGDGPGWVDRLEAALKAGAILPATAAAIYAGAQAQQQQQGDEGL